MLAGRLTYIFIALSMFDSFTVHREITRTFVVRDTLDQSYLWLGLR
jgi:hypothetical protein